MAMDGEGRGALAVRRRIRVLHPWESQEVGEAVR